MDKTKVFLKYSLIAQRDAKDVMEKIQKTIQWKDNCTVLDVGCGPGNNTHDVLFPKIPKLKNLVGVDRLGDMIKYANENYRNGSSIDFKEMDIVNVNVSQTDYENYFDHVFSFYCLHFIGEQELALKNIYKLTKPGGDFFFTCTVQCNLFEIVAYLANTTIWNKYVRNHNKFTCPYQFSTDPKRDIQKVLQNVGFNVLHTSAEPKNIKIPLNIFTEMIVSHSPLDIPMDVAHQEEFQMTCLDAVRKLKLNYVDDNGKEFYQAKYHTLFGHAIKPL